MTQRLKLIALLTSFVCLSACSAASRQCASWKLQGEMMSSSYACEQCLDRLGGDDVNVIRGCALGVDAARLLESTSTNAQ